MLLLDMHPGKITPGSGERLWSGFVQAIPWFGRRLLQHEEIPCLAASGRCDVACCGCWIKAKAEKRDIRRQRALEEWIAFRGTCRTGSSRQTNGIASRWVHELSACIFDPLCLNGVDHCSWIAPQQITSYQQDGLRAGTFPAHILPELALPVWNGLNILQRLDLLWRGGDWDMAPLIPELTEISAPLVCRIATPQEFTSHLVIEADHECLNEARIGGEGGNRVGWNVLHARQHVALGERKQGVIHRSGEFGRDHHWFKGVRCFADVRPDDALLKAPDNAHF